VNVTSWCLISMRDLICYIVDYCVWSCGAGKTSVYDNIVMENLKKGWKWKIFLC